MGTDNTRYEKAMVKHSFSREERLELAEQMAEAEVAASNVKEELDHIKSQYQARIKQHEAARWMCAEKLRAGFEMRELECPAQIEEHGGRKLVVLYHPVTGEVVFSRPLSQQEAQQQLPLDPLPEVRQ